MTDNLTSCNTLQELAAAQAREAKLRGEFRKMQWWANNTKFPLGALNIVMEALALPADDTALKEALRKAKIEALREAADELYRRDAAISSASGWLMAIADDLGKEMK